MRSATSLRDRVGALVGGSLPNRDSCAICGGSTALGKASTMLGNQPITICWRKECGQELQRLVVGELEDTWLRGGRNAERN